MPEFKNKEEYEKWKAERLENPHATNKKPPQNYGSKIGWVLIFFLYSIILMLVLASLLGTNNSSNSTDKQKTSLPYELQNSSWDASVPAVMRWFQANLKDPESFKAIEWSPTKKVNDNSYFVRCKYRAKNSFGGYVVENRVFFMNAKGEIILIQDYDQLQK